VRDVTGDEWCVEVRDGPGRCAAEHWTADVEAFLATLTGPAEVRGLRYATFGRRSPTIALPTP
jgi:hypothetical protein